MRQLKFSGPETKGDKDAFHFGKMAHYSRPDMAYLDFDLKRPNRNSPRLNPLFVVSRLVGVHPEWFCYERTRRGWHVIIKLAEKLKRAELVALQACLGSDRRREALNLMRVLGIRCYGVTGYWARRWNILYGGKLLNTRRRK
jgi:hypothetical protein